jgi:DNA-binding SARP family transcriptional activator
LHVQVLGPVSICRDGRPLQHLTRKAAALVVLLAVQGAMPRDRIAAWLWPNGGAAGIAGARRNLRRELSRLREAGGAGLFDATRSTLALAAGPALDLAAFQSHMAANRPDAALAHWRGSLADGLWLGDASDFDAWLDAARGRLAAQRAAALEALAEQREAQGDVPGALDCLASLLADEPLQERIQHRLMQLQAQSGRREAALATYESFRRLLHDELGVAPMAPIEDLARSLHQPGAPSRSPNPQPSPQGWATSAARPKAFALDLPFVGREAEREWFDQAWASGRTLLIEGVGGVGKTRLASELAAAHRAFAVSRCRPGDAAVPYAAFTRALKVLAGTALDSTALAGWMRDELARVLPEFGQVCAPIASAAEQRRFFEACAGAWSALTEGSFDAVLIDDWHFADASSQTLFAFIAQSRAERQRVAPREVFVLRPELSDPARQVLHRLRQGGVASALHLQPLGAEHTTRLVQQLMASRSAAPLAAQLQRTSAGNPFFMAEALRHWLALGLLQMDEQGRWFAPAPGTCAEWPLPGGVLEAVLLRLLPLGEATRRLLDAAALASEPFDAVLLAGACALSEVEALTAIGEALAAQLLTEREGGGWAFAHDLLRLALESALWPERRRLVHRRLALAAMAAGQPSALIAAHWEGGGQPQRAVAHRLQAAEDAAALYEHDAAMLNWQAALDDGASLAERLRLHGARWLLQFDRGDGSAVDESLTALDQLAGDPAAGPALALRAAIEAAAICVVSGRGDALGRIEHSLAHPLAQPGGEAALRARALDVCSNALNALGRADEAADAAEAALQIGALEPRQQGRLLHALMHSAFLRDRPGEALAFARRALAVWQAIGARAQVARANQNIGTMLHGLGQHEAGDAQQQLALRQARELQLPDLQRVALLNLSQRLLRRADAAGALKLIDEGLALAREFARPAHRIALLSSRARAQHLAGALGDAMVDAEAAFALAQSGPGHGMLVDCVSMLLDLYTDIGDADGAARLLAAVPADPPTGKDFFSIKLVFNRIHHALSLGRVALARALVDGLGEPDLIGNADDRIAARVHAARVQLAEGHAAAARASLASLVAVEPPAADAALRVLICTLRLRAGGPGAAEAAQAADGELALAHQCAFPLLALAMARHDRARDAGDVSTARRLRGRMAAERARLAGSLASHPAQQSLLLAHFAGRRRSGG